MIKILRFLEWTLNVILSGLFLIAATAKFSTESIMYENFLRWGYNGLLMGLVGIMEGIGGILLLIPKTRKYGAYILLIIMCGAMVTHFLNFEELGLPIQNTILILLLSLIAYLNKSFDLKFFKRQLIRK